MAIKIRDYEVRLTRNKDERKLVRQLRYRCFVEEEGFPVTDEQKSLKEEWDSYDTYASYIGVFHKGKIVGTYRILDRDAAEKMDGFYSETEFDITKIKKRRGNIAEMSRACIDKEYRDSSLVMSMLWMGLSEYIQKHKVQLLFGMVSFAWCTPIDRAQAVSYVYYHHLAPMNLRATIKLDKLDPAVHPKMTKMNILPKIWVDKEKAYKEMPPLMKGYLRLNGKFGNGSCIVPKEHGFDLSVIVLTKNISKAYQKRFAGKPDAFENLGLKDSPMATAGKILLLPFKGVFLTLKAVAGLFLDESDLKDAEIEKDEVINENP